MTQKTFDDTIKQIQETFDFDELFDIIQTAAGVGVLFDCDTIYDIFKTDLRERLNEQ